MKTIIVDAETNGLYGETLSIGAIVLDEKLSEIVSFYGELQLKCAQFYEPWVLENVVPYLDESNPYATEKELLSAFWEFWLSHREDSYCLADVAFPVETSLFRKCVQMDSQQRSFLGPFPLLDLSSFLMAKGYNPLVKRLTLVDTQEFREHYALDDVRITAEIWRKINAYKTV